VIVTGARGNCTGHGQLNLLAALGMAPPSPNLPARAQSELGSIAYAGQLCIDGGMRPTVKIGCA
jgi:hypothetical protein